MSTEERCSKTATDANWDQAALGRAVDKIRATKDARRNGWEKKKERQKHIDRNQESSVACDEAGTAFAAAGKEQSDRRALLLVPLPLAPSRSLSRGIPVGCEPRLASLTRGSLFPVLSTAYLVEAKLFFQSTQHSPKKVHCQAG